jgi:VanZ family protein
MRKYLDIPLTLIVTLTLTVAMLWPMDQPPPAPEGSDKLVHFIAFAALAFPLARTGRFGLLPVFIGASAFGGIIELIQPSFNRSADINDWIADVVGVALGIGCGLLYRRLRRR